MSQSYSKKVSTVYCILNNPTSFLDTYEVASIRSKMANGKLKESVYGENEDLGTRTINVTFIKKTSKILIIMLYYRCFEKKEFI